MNLTLPLEVMAFVVDSEWTYVAPSPQSLTPFGGYYTRTDRPPIDEAPKVRYDDGPLPPSTWFDDGYARASRTHPGKLRHHGFEAGWELGRVDRTGFKTWNWLGRHVGAYTEHADDAPCSRALDQHAARSAGSLDYDDPPREPQVATEPREAPAPARPLSAASFV